MVAIGDLPGDVSDSIEEALGPTGARLVGVGVVREPVDVRGLAGDLSKTRFADIAEQPGHADAPSAPASAARSSAAAPCSSGCAATSSPAPAATSARLDGVIVVRSQPEEMGPMRRATAGQLESALMSGIVGDPAPGGRGRDLDSRTLLDLLLPGQRPLQRRRRRLVAGRLATVFALLGAEGSFGVKGCADRLLPDLPAAAGAIAPASAGK